jgi:hypothetical protein
MADLGTLADQGTPLAADLKTSASALGREFTELTPFANSARTSLTELGAAAAKSQAPLVGTIPLARQLNSLGTQAAPAATSLDRLTASLSKTGAIGQLMALLFYGTTATNGFDSLGHYVRDELLVSDCTGYATTPVPGCSANFTKSSASADSTASAAGDLAGTEQSPASKRLLSAALAGDAIAQNTAAPLQRLLSYLIGPGG